MANHHTKGFPMAIDQILAELVSTWNVEADHGSPQHCHQVPGLWDGDSIHPKGSPCRECALYDQVRSHVKTLQCSSDGKDGQPPSGWA